MMIITTNANGTRTVTGTDQQGKTRSVLIHDKNSNAASIFKQVTSNNQTNQASQTSQANPTQNNKSITSSNGAYSIFTKDENNKPTNIFSAENLGANLATNIEQYTKQGGNLNNVQKFELAPQGQTGNGFSGAIGQKADNKVIDATVRHLTKDENKNALSQMCQLFGIQGSDYNKLSEAMIKANKDNNLELTKEEIDAYKKQSNPTTTSSSSLTEPAKTATTDDKGLSGFLKRLESGELFYWNKKKSNPAL